jgi:prepilin signal peptidase PulO-like enzyme (type II secretory pathway)
VDRLLLCTGAAAAGALVVGPLLNHAVLRWIGWRGVLPLLLGWEPRRTELGRPRPRCRRCGAPLTPGSWSSPSRRRLARVGEGADPGGRPPADRRAGAEGPALADGLAVTEGAAPADRPAPPPGPPGPPVLAWLGAGGRCRACGERIGRWVGGVEIATGSGFGLAAARAGWSAELLPVLVLVAGVVAAAAVDLACCRIPTRFVYLTGAAATVAAAVEVAVDGEAGAVVGALVGGAAFLGVLGTLYLLGAGRMGFGDVRLGTLIGLVAGWVGWAPDRPVDGPLGVALLGLLLASLTASLVGLVLLVARRHSRPYPFGPWLALGGLVAILSAV